MGDDARREAERRWRETGSVDDGRRYLAHVERAGEPALALKVRLAIGDLHEERARLAAHLGDPVAREALAVEDAPIVLLSAWAQRLFDWGQAACVRGALAAARAALTSGAPVQGDAEAALAAAERWLECPCPRHYGEAEAFNAQRSQLEPWVWHTVTAAHCPPRACWHHVQAITGAAQVASEARVRAAVRDALVAWALPREGGDARLERPATTRGVQEG